MQQQVLTPITQALNDGVLTRRELKLLMQRSNRPAVLHLLVWVCVLAATSFLIYLSLGTFWLIPAMFVHGVILVHHFSLQHECSHFTVFRTRWLNELVGTVCGFIILVPHQFFRFEHCDHHTYTQLKGKDPEIIELPISLGKYLAYVSAIPYFRAQISGLIRRAAGRLTEAEQKFLPKDLRPRIILESRLTLAGYAAILGFCIATGWWAPVWYWWLPLLMGEPVMRAIRMTEHVGRPNVRDMKINTRTNLVSRPMQFLCWNMNYHAEHHYASSVPFHALPRLHEKLADYIYVEKRGYLGAHQDIIAQLLGRKPRSDSDAFVS